MLCRGLQKENKEVLEDSRRRTEEELKNRQSLQAKFSSAIDDVRVSRVLGGGLGRVWERGDQCCV